MDDITWKKKLRQRRTRIIRRLFLFFLLICAAAVAAFWYFFIYVRTPEYALKQLSTAIENRDEDAVKRYVNFSVLSSRAYDDLTADLFNYDATLTPATRANVEKFYVLVKPQLTDGMTNAVLDRVKTGSWDLPQGTDILKGRQLGIDFERFLERTQIRNTTFVRIASVDHDKTTATANIDIIEDYTQTPFTLQVVMEQAADGRWQISYIKNYKDYLDTISPIQNKDIDSYIEATKDIVSAYNQTLAADQAQFKAMTQTSSGQLSDAQKTNIVALLDNNVIPTLMERQQKLDAVDVAPGAQYLARQRQQSTEMTIKAWRHYIKGLQDNDPGEFDTAETLLKQVLAIDLRAQDIIRHTAISHDIPNLP